MSLDSLKNFKTMKLKQNVAQIFKKKAFQIEKNSFSTEVDKDAFTSEGTPSRQKWSSKLDFIFTCVSSSIGLGNLWRFPYICYRNGGGAFLIPYFMSVVFIAIPMSFLELSLGQYTSQGAITAWKISPASKGVGISMLMNIFWSCLCYILLSVWILFYFFHSFTLTLPWSTCGNPWNTQYCITGSFNHSDPIVCSNALKHNSFINSMANVSFGLLDSSVCFNVSDITTPAQEFFDRKMLNLSKGLDEVGAMNWQLAGCLLLAWMLCFLCLFKGIKWLGTVTKVTAIAPYIFLIILLIRSSILPGASDGILYYLKPNFSKILEPKVWNDAITQVLYSYCIGMTIQIALGSFNPYHKNVMRYSIIISAINSCTSIFAGLVIFSMLGSMAKQQGKILEDVVDSGPGLVFLVYPSAIALLPMSAIWAVIFFLCLFFLGFSSQLVSLESFITTLIDLWPQKLRRRKALLTLLSCIGFFLVCLPMVTQGGIYVFELLNYYTIAGITLTIVTFFECIAISYGYGVNRYMKALEHMLGFKPGKWWKFCWLVMTPLFFLANMVLSIVFYESLSYQNYIFPFWSVVIGWCIMLLTLIFIPSYCLYTLIKIPGSFKERIKQGFRPFVPDEPVRSHIDSITSL